MWHIGTSVSNLEHSLLSYAPVAYWGSGLKGFNPSPEIPKAFQNRAKLNPIWKLLKIAEFRTPTRQDIRKKGSKILKLPPVRNCFTLAMTDKLAVIINNLKVPKIKKILLYETKFLVPNYSCLQNPWLGGYCPQIPVLPVLCPQLNLLNPSRTNSWVRNWSDHTATGTDTKCFIHIYIEFFLVRLIIQLSYLDKERSCCSHVVFGMFWVCNAINVSPPKLSGLDHIL